MGNGYANKIPESLWDQIRERYISGSESCKAIALDLGINPKAVSSRCSREGWQQLRDQRVLRALAAKSEGDESGKSAKLLALLPDAPKPLAVDTPLPEPEEVADRIKREGLEWLDIVRDARLRAEELGTPVAKLLKDYFGAWKNAADSVSKAFGLNHPDTIQGTPFLQIALNTAPLPIEPPKPPTIDISESAPAADSMLK